MNKADLIDRIAAGSRINKTQAAAAIDTMVDSVTGALRKGDRVALVGFGTFSVSQRKARNGRSPQSGQIYPGSRTEESGKQEIGKMILVKRQGVGPAAFLLLPRYTQRGIN